MSHVISIQFDRVRFTKDDECEKNNWIELLKEKELTTLLYKVKFLEYQCRILKLSFLQQLIMPPY